MKFDYRGMINETMDTLRTLFNIIEDYVFIVNESGSIIEVNESAREKLGYSRKELLGANILHLYPPERHEEAFKSVQKMLEGQLYKNTIPLFSKEGKYIYVETRVFIGKWLGKNVAFGISKDISKFKNQQRFFQSMIDAIPDLVFFKDNNRSYLGCNNAFASKFIGLRKEDVISKKDRDLLEDDSMVDFIKQKDIEVLESEKSSVYEQRIALTNGNSADVETVKTPFYDENGNVAGLIGIARDISERKLAEKQLQVQTDYAEMLLNTVPSAVFSVDNNKKILSWNKWAEYLTGYSTEEAVGKNCSLFSEDPCKEQCGLKLNEASQPMIGKVCTIINKDGNRRYISKNVAVIRNKMGEVTGGIECFDDITERIKIEEQLRESEERYSAIVNCAPEIVVIFKVGIIVFVNDSGLRASGYTKDEVIGQSVQKFVSKKSNELILENMKRRLIGDTIGDFEIEFIKKTGELSNLIVKTSPITYENEFAVLAVLVDITERKRAEEELNKKEKILSAVAMSIKEFLDCSDYLVAVTNSFELLGTATQADRIYLFQNSTDVAGNRYTNQKVEWNSGTCESQITNSDLQEIPFPKIYSFIEPLIRGEAYFGIVKELKDDRTREILTSQNILSIAVIPVFVRGDFWGFVGLDDCTYERKWSEAEFSVLRAFANSLERAIERSLINEELEKSKKTAETASILKGQFLANMSHEIRTPMNGIVGFVELLCRTDLTREQRGFLGQIKSASNALLLLINDILDYSKIEADKLELENILFDMHALVNDSINLFVPKANRKGIRINLFIEGNVPKWLNGDPNRLRQVLNNIVGNALKFTEAGEVDLKLFLREEREKSVKIQLQISDTGIGISKEVLPRLFTVFSQADTSTTRKYGGTGLGLAISQRIIKLMHGQISVNSVLGKGSTFLIELELNKHNANTNLNQENIQILSRDLLTTDYGAQKELSDEFSNVEKEEKGLPNKAIRNKELTILLVEDTLANQKLAIVMLGQLGYKTELAGNGHKAVEMCKITKYDIILMDCQMPIMDGYVASSRIKNEGLNKDTVVIAMTAHAMEGDRDKCLKAGMDDYISKPILMNDLDKMIQKWLKK
ncbi:PAS domain S-box protein [Desulfosporosinus meridiei]|uniref:Circadian input-output histidine kinase CikA n=1 Tax=Desulfosporosinus meridiei (strain ATCC BAA-275 / DSM 13257 / KCTC 12902 / NCIMB 13706 / S10) TaxID=768704 RepID=J7ILJ0_DESMD|nr:PAS domain S-box protein [Desulfosporosinus meridiei]AFQ42415.1 PAS domain S-box [Desulfosporosinus meridiei DSM 13257]